MATLLLGTTATGFTDELTLAEGRIEACWFLASETGVLEEIQLKTGSTANTATSVRIGIYTREGEIPKGEEPSGISPFFSPGAPLAEGVLSGKPGTNATLTVTGLSVEVEAGLAYFIALLPIGGNVHFKCQNTTGKELAESAAAGHTTLVKTTWSGGNGKGPIEAQGLGRVTSPSVSGATWLGLNRNAAYSYLGAINDFTKHGIVWDRVAIEAGKTSGTEWNEVKASVEAGMAVMVLIQSAGEKYPESTAEIETYAKELVKTVKAIREAYPVAELYFEIINEPYFATAEQEPAKYATILVEVFARCEAASIPLSVLVAAGRGKGWITGLYTAQSSLKTKIEGWSLHPYGAANGAEGWNSLGVQSVMALRAEMASGQNNIFITEIGWWVEGVNGATTVEPPKAESIKQAAEFLETAVKHAWRYHSSGWLKAYIIYGRGQTGFGLEETGAKINKAGEALIKFAEEQSRVVVPRQHLVRRHGGRRYG